MRGEQKKNRTTTQHTPLQTPQRSRTPAATTSTEEKISEDRSEDCPPARRRRATVDSETEVLAVRKVGLRVFWIVVTTLSRLTDLPFVQVFENLGRSAKSRVKEPDRRQTRKQEDCQSNRRQLLQYVQRYFSTYSTVDWSVVAAQKRSKWFQETDHWFVASAK